MEPSGDAQGPMQGPMKDAIWLSWHRSGRTLDLSRMLGLRLVAWQLEAPAVLRHPASALWSIHWLCRLRPRRIVLQHSFLLALIVSAYKRLAPFPVRVVDDCHTKALRRQPAGLFGPLFRWLREWSMQSFDGLLVATPTIAEEAMSLGVPLVVLPDPVPDLPSRFGPATPASAPTVVVIGSFAEDEPIEQVLRAAGSEPGVAFVMTGRQPRSFEMGTVPGNVRLAGFLDWPDYLALLGSADVIVVLTTHPGTILRGACEALAMSKPLVTSDTDALRDYVGDAAVFVEPVADDIQRGVVRALREQKQLIRAGRLRRDQLTRRHTASMEDVRALLTTSEAA